MNLAFLSSHLKVIINSRNSRSKEARCNEVLLYYECYNYKDFLLTQLYIYATYLRKNYCIAKSTHFFSNLGREKSQEKRVAMGKWGVAGGRVPLDAALQAMVHGRPQPLVGSLHLYALLFQSPAPRHSPRELRLSEGGQ